jgi:hypothetical protein
LAALSLRVSNNGTCGSNGTGNGQTYYRPGTRFAQSTCTRVKHRSRCHYII